MTSVLWDYYSYKSSAEREFAVTLLIRTALREKKGCNLLTGMRRMPDSVAP